MQACSSLRDFLEERENNSNFDRMERITKEEQRAAEQSRQRREHEEATPEMTRALDGKYAYVIVKTVPSHLSGRVYVDRESLYDSEQASKGIRVTSDTSHLLEVRAQGFKPCSFRIRLNQKQREVLKCRLDRSHSRQ
jgi:hypothetical protein